MEVSGTRRLRELDPENGRVRRLVAEAHLDKPALKNLLSRSVRPRRAAGSLGPSDATTTSHLVDELMEARDERRQVRIQAQFAKLSLSQTRGRDVDAARWCRRMRPTGAVPQWLRRQACRRRQCTAAGVLRILSSGTLRARGIRVPNME